MSRRRARLSIALLTAAAMLLSGCSSDGDGAAESADKDLTPSKRLPAEIQKSGVLDFASDISYPPFEFYDEDNKTPVGFDIDLAHAVSEQLGVRAEFTPTKFAGIPAQLKSGRTLVAISAMSDSKDRRDAANFVNYLDIQAMITYRTDEGGPGSPEDLCGVKVGVQTGSIGHGLIVDKAKEDCAAAGEPTLEVHEYPDAPAQILAVESGRVDAAVVDSAVGGYLVSHTNDKLSSGEPFGDTYTNGIAVAVGNDELTKAVQWALQELMDNGEYLELVEKWGMDTGALAKARINSSPF